MEETKIKKKLILDASSNFEYRRMIDEYAKTKKDYLEELESLDKKTKKAKDDFWDKMVEKLQADNLLDKSYNNKTSREGLVLEGDSMCIFLETEPGGRVPDFIKDILKKL